MSLYKDFFGVPFDKDVRAPVWLPHYMYQDHSKHVMRNVSRFRLRAHTLLVDRAILSCDACSPIYDECDLQEVQDEARALFKCTVRRPANYGASTPLSFNMLPICRLLLLACNL